MKPAWALFLLNLRATALRHVFAPLCISLVVAALLAYAGSGPLEAEEEALALALLGILAFMQAPLALAFSPLEDLVLSAHSFRRSWPLSPRSYGTALLLSAAFPPIATAGLGVAFLGFFFHEALGNEGVLFSACFAFRMALGGALFALTGYWARMVYHERAWVRNGGFYIPFLLFAGIAASHSAAGAKILMASFKALASPSLGAVDLFLGVLLFATWVLTVRLDKVLP